MSAISSPLLSLHPSHSRLSPPSSRPFFPSLSRFSGPSLPLLSTSFRSRPVFALEEHQQLSETTGVSVDSADPSSEFTCFVIRARNKIGLLQIITRVFKVLGLRIEKANVEFEGEFFVKKFFVTDSHGKKIEDSSGLSRIETALREAIDEADGAVAVPSSSAAASRGFVVRRAGMLPDTGERRAKAERMFRLMDGFRKNDPVSLQKDILDHVEFTVARSRFSFDDFEAYQALSHSIRDRLIERWHDTQQYFKRKDPKRLYFLSLEFLMGRSLSNSVINLGIRDNCADALKQLGFEFEVVAEQEGDAALGNGGLARLSACQMDSLATMDFPAWG